MESSRDRNIDLWDGLYAQQHGLLEYPDDVLVRIAHRLFNRDTHNRVLDYGFGGGSNLIHFLKKGFTGSGVEVSDHAIEILSQRLHKLGYEANLQSNKGGTIPFEDHSFDVVIAWQVLYYNDRTTFYDAMKEIDRVLRPGGIFLGTMGAVGDYSHTHSEFIGNNIYKSTVPGQEGATTMMLDQSELPDLFKGKNITIGESGYRFGERHSKHWIVSYER